MATYGQLLIDAGGGVIDHGKQSARQDGATLVIGLGGTGSDAVMKLKKEVFKQLKPDDENAVLPTYSAIKYLVVDSDASKINRQESLRISTGIPNFLRYPIPISKQPSVQRKL